MDLVAALATGLAGAVAPARRDVAAVLPGVAIAISPVPPLVVTGVCRGRLSGWPALGVLVPFVSNLFALVFGGMVMFAALGCREGRHRGHGGPAAARMWPGPGMGPPRQRAAHRRGARGLRDAVRGLQREVRRPRREVRRPRREVRRLQRDVRGLPCEA